MMCVITEGRHKGTIFAIGNGVNSTVIKSNTLGLGTRLADLPEKIRQEIRYKVIKDDE